MKQESTRSRVLCTSTECPRVDAFFRGEKGISMYTPRRQAFRDMLGNYWCEACTKRGEIINWAVSHHYPEVNCPPYAIAGGDDELWKAALYLGQPDFIETLHTFIFAEDAQSA